MPNKYIVWLGNEGYEAMLDISHYEDYWLEIKMLEGGFQSLDRTDIRVMYLERKMAFLNSMELRCRFNGHREIEAYILECEGTLKPEDISESDDFQNLIRETCELYYKE